MQQGKIQKHKSSKISFGNVFYSYSMAILTFIITYLYGILSSKSHNNSQCHQSSDGYGKSSFAILFVSSVGLIVAAAAYYHQRHLTYKKLVPRIKYDRSKRVVKLERFSHYVARQLGFSDRRLCPQLNKLASDYIQKREGWEETIYSIFAQDPDCDSLFIKLVEEIERCILSYFAFHWSFAETALKQVMQGPEPEPKKKLKHILLAASREKTIERVTKDLKVARVFTTLVQEMKAIGLAQPRPEIDESECTDVMAPVAFKDRSPVLLFMGGGMGAGKSTVLKDILIEPFWQEASGQAVVIEADAFKETDLFYKALSSRGHHDAVHTAELKGYHMWKRCKGEFTAKISQKICKCISTLLPTCRPGQVVQHECFGRATKGWKDRDKTLLVDPEEFKCVKLVADLNEDADNIYELYKRPNPACQDGSIWNDIVSSPSRVNVQQELKYSIQRVERSLATGKDRNIIKNV